MADEVFLAINSDALYSKSKVYMSRAMARKENGDLDEYQLWASLALELLGKAALSRQHPCLVVDPAQWQSIFVAAGINITTDVKTIGAKTLFERLAHLVPRFDKSVQKFCFDIAERRNAELHSADLPFRTMRLEAWEERYWHAADTILRHILSSLEDWLGAADAASPRRLLQEAASALDASIKLRIQVAKEWFLKLKKSDREELQAAADERQTADQAALFPYQYEVIWAEACPACGCRAFITGEQVGETISHEPDAEAIWEIVDREFEGEVFKCPTCELSLSGTEELEAAGLSDTYADTVQREMDYEPDYGND